MKQAILLRTASLLTLIFCAGHTYGTLKHLLPRPRGSGGIHAMQAYPFSIMGFRRTHWDFYRGFSLLFSVALLLLAVLLWQLGGLAKSDPARTRPLVAMLASATSASRSCAGSTSSPRPLSCQPPRRCASRWRSHPRHSPRVHRHAG